MRAALLALFWAAAAAGPSVRRQLPPLPAVPDEAPTGEGLGAPRSTLLVAPAAGPGFAPGFGVAGNGVDAADAHVPAAVSQELSVVVPDGVEPGGQLSVTAPDGQKLHVVVPADMQPGQIILVKLPADSLTSALPAAAAPQDSAAAPQDTALPVFPHDVEPVPPVHVPVPSAPVTATEPAASATPAVSAMPGAAAAPVASAAPATSAMPANAAAKSSMAMLTGDISHLTPDTEDAHGWVPVPCAPGDVECSVPTMKTYELHTSTDGSMLSGVWEATPGSYRTNFIAYEFVHMIYGRIVITPDDGSPAMTVQGGDTFVMEADFKGTWKIEQAVRKYFTYHCVNANCD